ncbi:hypothetical protein ENROMM299B_22410 [Enterobacter roggenkampii]
MRQYHRSRVEVQSTFDHFPGMDFSAVNRAAKERFMAISWFWLSKYNTRNSSRSSAAICSRSHSRTACEEVKAPPGLMQVPVQSPERPLNETPVLWRHLAG